MRDQIFNDPKQAVLGNPQGDVTLVEFFDYNCGYCRHALADTDKLLKSDKNIRYVLKEFPILGPDSVAACDQVRAVDKQRLTARRGRLTPADMKAVENGLRTILGL